MNCRHCNTALQHVFLDLGFAPPSNAYLTSEQLQQPEAYFPLKLFVCHECWLVQTDDYTEANDLFRHDYAYYSSTSTSWMEHAARYTSAITKSLGLGQSSYVVEVASNDGYLLRNFLALGIPCLGIEPTEGTAKVAEALGIPVLREFFGDTVATRLVAEKKQADLIIGNNVYAHVPDINGFTNGLKTLLKKDGVITLEFPHLMRLIDGVQFDTVYHEHFSYLSLQTVSCIFAKAGLRVWYVEELATHGGSLRVYGCHEENQRTVHHSVRDVLAAEASHGLRELSTYLTFQPKADLVKNNLLIFLIEQKRANRVVAAYGAAAKGNTLLNYAGIKPDLLPFVVDAAAAKQDKFMPGSHLPILSPTTLTARKVDYLLILPWNIAKEVMQQNAHLGKSGTRFVTAVPRLEII